jgi:3-oxoacyl-[acyl-carrier protein] reductase
MDTGLKDKVVVVTGAGGGIGAAIARSFASEGARVAVHYRSSRERAESVAGQIGGVALHADLTLEHEVDALFESIETQMGSPEVLVANAGFWPPDDEPVWAMSYDRWRTTLTSNLDATFLSCRAFLRRVERSGRGNIVIVSSTAGLIGEAGHSDYASSKSALSGGFLKSLKNEIVRIAPQGRVNAVAPGWTETDMTRDAIAAPQFLERITRTMAMRKLGQAEDVARVVVALASDEISGHVTGEVVAVAGGMEGRVLHDLD